jgi:hypothetical protein
MKEAPSSASTRRWAASLFIGFILSCHENSGPHPIGRVAEPLLQENRDEAFELVLLHAHSHLDLLGLPVGIGQYDLEVWSNWTDANTRQLIQVQRRTSPRLEFMAAAAILYAVLAGQAGDANYMPTPDLESWFATQAEQQMPPSPAYVHADGPTPLFLLNEIALPPEDLLLATTHELVHVWQALQGAMSFNGIESVDQMRAMQMMHEGSASRLTNWMHDPDGQGRLRNLDFETVCKEELTLDLLPITNPLYGFGMRWAHEQLARGCSPQEMMEQLLQMPIPSTAELVGALPDQVAAARHVTLPSFVPLKGDTQAWAASTTFGAYSLLLTPDALEHHLAIGRVESLGLAVEDWPALVLEKARAHSPPQPELRLAQAWRADSCAIRMTASGRIDLQARFLFSDDSSAREVAAMLPRGGTPGHHKISTVGCQLDFVWTWDGPSSGIQDRSVGQSRADDLLARLNAHPIGR